MYIESNEIPVPEVEYAHTSIVLCEFGINGISTGKGLPWNIKLDKDFFIKFVSDPRYLPVCGKNTYADLPKFLKDSFLCIGSSQNVKTLDDAISLAESQGRFILVCGGEGLYNEAFKNKKVKVFIENYILHDVGIIKYTRFYNVDNALSETDTIIEQDYISLDGKEHILHTVSIRKG